MNTLSRLSILAAAFAALGAAPVQAAVLTVGSGGAYASIQPAINAALAAAGDDEIRVHTGPITRA
jgi:hypothetical protein